MRKVILYLLILGSLFTLSCKKDKVEEDEKVIDNIPLFYLNAKSCRNGCFDNKIEIYPTDLHRTSSKYEIENGYHTFTSSIWKSLCPLCEPLIFKLVLKTKKEDQDIGHFYKNQTFRLNEPNKVLVTYNLFNKEEMEKVIWKINNKSTFPDLPNKFKLDIGKEMIIDSEFHHSGRRYPYLSLSKNIISNELENCPEDIVTTNFENSDSSILLSANNTSSENNSWNVEEYLGGGNSSTRNLGNGGSIEFTPKQDIYSYVKLSNSNCDEDIHIDVFKDDKIYLIKTSIESMGTEYFVEFSYESYSTNYRVQPDSTFLKITEINDIDIEVDGNKVRQIKFEFDVATIVFGDYRTYFFRGNAALPITIP